MRGCFTLLLENCTRRIKRGAVCASCVTFVNGCGKGGARASLTFREATWKFRARGPPWSLPEGSARPMRSWWSLVSLVRPGGLPGRAYGMSPVGRRGRGCRVPHSVGPARSPCGGQPGPLVRVRELGCRAGPTLGRRGGNLRRSLHPGGRCLG
jgi:hypothetical protein